MRYVIEPRQNHRDAVGPEQYWDHIGQMQFDTLLSLGLLPHHNLLDIGCGCLRAGRLLVPYLNTGRYYGIDPNAWLIEAGVREELDRAIYEEKSPTFSNSDTFDFDFGVSMDFFLAHSIFTHAPPTSVRLCIRNAKEAAAPRAVFAGTFRVGRDPGEDWKHPHCFRYSTDTLVSWFADQSFSFSLLNILHPMGQQWFVARRGAQ